MIYWNCLHLDVLPSIADTVSALCHEAGSCGISINDRSSLTHLEVYFPDHIDLDSVEFMLKKTLSGNLEVPLKTTLTKIEEADWTKSWREFFRPIWVTPEIVVHPPWIPIQEKGVISIAIEPKMAFGTGGHESTQLCLQMLSKKALHGMNCLDLGTGTGILAIAASMKGAKRILALDTDKNALKNAIENIKLNGVARSRIMVRLGSTDSSVGDTYDIIFANIQSSILRTMLLNLKELVNPSGTIIFSGLLETERLRFCQSIEANDLIVSEIAKKNEWISISAERGR